MLKWFGDWKGRSDCLLWQCLKPKWVLTPEGRRNSWQIHISSLQNASVSLITFAITLAPPVIVMYLILKCCLIDVVNVNINSMADSLWKPISSLLRGTKIPPTIFSQVNSNGSPKTWKKRYLEKPLQDFIKWEEMESVRQTATVCRARMGQALNNTLTT